MAEIPNTYEELRAKDPINADLVRVYAKRFGYGDRIDEFLAEVIKQPGDSIVDKLKAYTEQREGLRVRAYLLDVLPEKHISGDDYSFYRLPFRVIFDEEGINTIMSAVQGDDALKEHLSSAPLVGLRVYDRNYIDRLRRSTVCSELTFGGFTVSVSERRDGLGKIYYLNARSVRVGQPNEEVARNISFTVDNIADETFEDREVVYLYLNTPGVVDPLLKETQTGKPRVTVYFGDAIEVSFIDRSVSALQRTFTNPWDPSVWQTVGSNYRICVRAQYAGESAGRKRFNVFDVSGVAIFGGGQQ